MRLAAVTAHLDKEKTREFWGTWERDCPVVRVEGVLGPVRAFYVGTLRAWQEYGHPDLLACLHDDLQIHDRAWVGKVENEFRKDPSLLLAGFGGGLGLGEPWIYKRPFDPMSLVRKGFISNMDQAEAHGTRIKEVTQVACLDGFSLIGRAEFILAGFHLFHGHQIQHHAYDSGFGALARRWGGRTKMIPISCHHAGGVTAVGMPAWTEAAKAYGGEKLVWEHAHREVWLEFRDVLPFMLSGENR